MRRRELIIALGFAMAWPIAANGQHDVRALRSQILLMQAECIADKLAEFIKQVQNQVDWTTQVYSTGIKTWSSKLFHSWTCIITQMSSVKSFRRYPLFCPR